MVEPHDVATQAVNRHVGRNVLHDPGLATHHGQRADAAKLMNPRKRAHRGVVRDRYMAGESGRVGQDVAAADATVMRHARRAEYNDT